MSSPGYGGEVSTWNSCVNPGLVDIFRTDDFCPGDNTPGSLMIGQIRNTRTRGQTLFRA